MPDNSYLSRIKRVGLLGWPLGHSVSPAMQNAAFRAAGLDFEFAKVEIPPEQLAETVARMRDEGWAGANVTVPHKEAALRLADEPSEQTRAVGAANTLLFRDGRILARNTDVAGFLASWKDRFGLDRLRDAHVVVLGAGGAARAVIVALTHAQVARVTILNRKVERGRRILQGLTTRTWPNFEGSVGSLDADDFALALQTARAVVNTTSVGMAPDVDATPVPWPAALPQPPAVFDVIYNPRETRFLREARERGAETVDGLGMLVEQGAAAFELWTGCKAPREVMWEAAKAALG